MKLFLTAILNTYINTEIKQNLKNGKFKDDNYNLREVLLPTNCEEPDDDLFVPDNELLVDLNVSIF